MELSRSAGQPLLDMQSLKKLLPNGKRHKFINNQSVRSKHDDRIIRCWVFTKK